MYGLPQAGLLAQNRLITHLASHGYHQTEATCLFRHETNGTDFSLVVDDFGVKYSNKLGAQHLIDTLQKLYVITIDWTGTKYLGFAIAFNYEQHTVDISMPSYIDKVLQRFSIQQQEVQHRLPYTHHQHMATQINGQYPTIVMPSHLRLYYNCKKL